MLSIEQTRKILGKNADGLTDEDLTEIRDGYRLMAEVIFDKWLLERKAKNLNEKGQTVSSLEKPLPSSPSKKPHHRKQ